MTGHHRCLHLSEKVSWNQISVVICTFLFVVGGGLTRCQIRVTWLELSCRKLAYGVRVPKNTPRFRDWLGAINHKTQPKVRVPAMIYYSERTAKSGRKAVGWVIGCTSVPPSGVGTTCELWCTKEALQRLGAQGCLLGVEHISTSLPTGTKISDSQKESSCSHKTTLSAQCRTSEPPLSGTEIQVPRCQQGQPKTSRPSFVRRAATGPRCKLWAPGLKTIEKMTFGL